MFEFVRLTNAGMTYALAYKATHPWTKAKKKTWSSMGREIMAHYEEHIAPNIQQVAKIADMGADRLVQEIRAKLEAMTVKDVYEEREKVYIMEDGTEVKEPISVRVTSEVQDNTTQMKAIEAHMKLLGIGLPKEEGSAGATYNLIMNQQFAQILAVIGPTMNDEKQAALLKIAGGRNGNHKHGNTNDV